MNGRNLVSRTAVHYVYKSQQSYRQHNVRRNDRRYFFIVRLRRIYKTEYMKERLCHRRIRPVRHKQGLCKEIALHICTAEPFGIFHLKLSFHLFGKHYLIICYTLFCCAFHCLTGGVEVELYYIGKLKQSLCILAVFIIVKSDYISQLLKFYTAPYYFCVCHYALKQFDYEYIT